MSTRSLPKVLALYDSKKYPLASPCTTGSKINNPGSPVGVKGMNQIKGLSLAILFGIKFLVIAAGYMLQPLFVRQVPIDGFFQSFFELQRWCPTQFLVQAGGIDGIAEVMTGPVFHISNQFGRVAGRPAQLFIHNLAE